MFLPRSVRSDDAGSGDIETRGIELAQHVELSRGGALGHRNIRFDGKFERRVVAQLLERGARMEGDDLHAFRRIVEAEYPEVGDDPIHAARGKAGVTARRTASQESGAGEDR